MPRPFVDLSGEAARPHQGIGQQIPERLSSVPSAQNAGNKVIALPVLGGLHHDYHWAA